MGQHGSHESYHDVGDLRTSKARQSTRSLPDQRLRSVKGVRSSFKPSKSQNMAPSMHGHLNASVNNNNALWTRDAGAYYFSTKPTATAPTARSAARSLDGHAKLDGRKKSSRHNSSAMKGSWSDVASDMYRVKESTSKRSRKREGAADRSVREARLPEVFDESVASEVMSDFVPLRGSRAHVRRSGRSKRRHQNRMENQYVEENDPSLYHAPAASLCDLQSRRGASRTGIPSSKSDFDFRPPLPSDRGVALLPPVPPTAPTALQPALVDSALRASARHLSPSKDASRVTFRDKQPPAVCRAAKLQNSQSDHTKDFGESVAEYAQACDDPDVTITSVDMTLASQAEPAVSTLRRCNKMGHGAKTTDRKSPNEAEQLQRDKRELQLQLQTLQESYNKQLDLIAKRCVGAIKKQRDTHKALQDDNNMLKQKLLELEWENRLMKAKLEELGHTGSACDLQRLAGLIADDSDVDCQLSSSIHVMDGSMQNRSESITAVKFRTQRNGVGVVAGLSDCSDINPFGESAMEGINGEGMCSRPVSLMHDISSFLLPERVPDDESSTAITLAASIHESAVETSSARGSVKAPIVKPSWMNSQMSTISKASNSGSSALDEVRNFAQSTEELVSRLRDSLALSDLDSLINTLPTMTVPYVEDESHAGIEDLPVGGPLLQQLKTLDMDDSNASSIERMRGSDSASSIATSASLRAMLANAPRPSLNAPDKVEPDLLNTSSGSTHTLCDEVTCDGPPPIPPKPTISLNPCSLELHPSGLSAAVNHGSSSFVGRMEHANYLSASAYVALSQGANIVSSGSTAEEKSTKTLMELARDDGYSTMSSEEQGTGLCRMTRSPSLPLKHAIETLLSRAGPPPLSNTDRATSTESLEWDSLVQSLITSTSTCGACTDMTTSTSGFSSNEQRDRALVDYCTHRGNRCLSEENIFCRSSSFVDEGVDGWIPAGCSHDSLKPDRLLLSHHRRLFLRRYHSDSKLCVKKLRVHWERLVYDMLASTASKATETKLNRKDQLDLNRSFSSCDLTQYRRDLLLTSSHLNNDIANFNDGGCEDILFDPRSAHDLIASSSPIPEVEFCSEYYAICRVSSQGPDITGIEDTSPAEVEDSEAVAHMARELSDYCVEASAQILETEVPPRPVSTDLRNSTRHTFDHDLSSSSSGSEGSDGGAQMAGDWMRQLRSKRKGKLTPIRAAKECQLVRYSPPDMRPSILRKDVYKRYGKEERLVLQSFDFLLDYSDTSSMHSGEASAKKRLITGDNRRQIMAAKRESMTLSLLNLRDIKEVEVKDVDSAATTFDDGDVYENLPFHDDMTRSRSVSDLTSLLRRRNLDVSSSSSSACSLDSNRSLDSSLFLSDPALGDRASTDSSNHNFS